MVSIGRKISRGVKSFGKKVSSAAKKADTFARKSIHTAEKLSPVLELGAAAIAGPAGAEAVRQAIKTAGDTRRNVKKINFGNHVLEKEPRAAVLR